MRRKTRLLSLLLILCMVLSIMPTVALAEEITVTASGTCGDNLTWTLTSDGVLSIDGTGAMDDFSVTDATGYNRVFTTTASWKSHISDIRTVIIGENVTSIGAYAFYYATSTTGHEDDGLSKLQNLITEGNLRTIGEKAFYYSGLTSIDLPDTVTSIGAYAFVGCEDLQEATFGSRLTTIGHSAFLGCSSLAEVNLPSRLTSIDNCAFEDCVNLQKVTIPASLKTLPAAAFANCSKLTDVILPDGMTSIGQAAFSNCVSLAEVTIPDSVTYLGVRAFEQCDILETVTLGDGLTTTGTAFDNCTSLTEVYAGTGLTTLSFSGCSSLMDIYFEGNAPTSYSGIPEYTYFHYTPGTTGWTDSEAYDAAAGTWNGYALEVWEEKIPSYIVSFDSDGGSAVDAQTVKSGETVAAPTAPTKDGYTFLGWYNGETAYDFTTPVTSDLTLTAKWEEEKIYPTSVEKTSMVLGNDLSFLFAFTADGITGTDNYATITKTYADGIADRVERMEQSAWSSVVIGGKKHYTISFDGVAAKEMTDEMQVQIFSADGEPISEVYTDSIRDYAMRMIENGTSVQMFVDMLVFGAEAQKHFGYSHELATSKLTAEQLAQATQSVSYENQLVSDDGYRASSLMLENNIQLVLLFGGIDPTMTAEVSYADHYGSARNFTIAGSEFEKVIYKGETCYSITVDTLVMADARQPVTVTVKDADGNKVTSAADSVESYIARMSSSGTLYEAIMKFSDSAAASLKNWQ